MGNQPLERESRAHTDRCDSQGNKKRQHGNDAVKSHILAAKTVANIVRTSLVRTLGQGTLDMEAYGT